MPEAQTLESTVSPAIPGFDEIVTLADRYGHVPVEAADHSERDIARLVPGSAPSSGSVAAPCSVTVSPTAKRAGIPTERASEMKNEWNSVQLPVRVSQA